VVPGAVSAADGRPDAVDVQAVSTAATATSHRAPRLGPTPPPCHAHPRTGRPGASVDADEDARVRRRGKPAQE
jgi:hypothetical protein